jgi:hypothetical protein
LPSTPPAKTKNELAKASRENGYEKDIPARNLNDSPADPHGRSIWLRGIGAGREKIAFASKRADGNIDIRVKNVRMKASQ